MFDVMRRYYGGMLGMELVELGSYNLAGTQESLVIWLSDNEVMKNDLWRRRSSGCEVVTSNKYQVGICPWVHLV